jgi:hypothetical protein
MVDPSGSCSSSILASAGAAIIASRSLCIARIRDRVAARSTFSTSRTTDSSILIPPFFDSIAVTPERKSLQARTLGMAPSSGPTADRRHATPELRRRLREPCAIGGMTTLRLNHLGGADALPLIAGRWPCSAHAPVDQTLATLSLWRQSAQGQWGGSARR